MNKAEKFIEKSKEIHGNKYDYSLVEYKTDRIKVKIICPDHGIFEQVPYSHISGRGCKKCGGILISKSKKSNTNDFIKKSKEIHGNKYNYSLVEYKGNKIKVKIICIEHGIFEQKPFDHLCGCGCNICGGSKKLSTNEFVDRSNKIHNNLYDYSLTEYISTDRKVKIICKKHGVFEQTPHHHLMGCKCPKCYDDIDIKDKKLYILYDKKYNLYKIGFSKNIEVRRRDIENFIKSKIDIIKVFENSAVLENEIHKLYDYNRVEHPIKHSGYKEWFNITENTIEDISNYINHHNGL